jgi:predicted nuclease of predicted toxin-antitoxin system
VIPKLFIDEDLSELLAELLRKEGIDVLTVREAGMDHESDAALVLWAKQQQRVFVTHNKRDVNALATQIQGHAGVIVVQGVAALSTYRRIAEQIVDKITSVNDWNDVVLWVRA